MSDDVVQSLGKIVDVGRVQASHTDPAVLGHVDVPLLANCQNLRLRDAREREHADLARDVVPVTRGPESVELILEGLPHGHDATGHSVQVLFPLCEQCWVVEHDARDPGPVGGRVRDLRTLQDRQLARNALCDILRLRARGGHKVEGSCSFAIEAKVFGERLGDDQFEALLHEVPDTEVVLCQITGSEALICAVEEGEQLPFSADLGDLFPLIFRRVDACGIVCTCVEQDNTTGLRGVQSGQQTITVEHFRLGREVRIRLDGQMDIGEDLIVVGPGWVREIDGRCGLRKELGQEETSQMDGTRA